MLSTRLPELRTALDELVVEHRQAAASPLRDNRLYMDDLEADLEATRQAYVGMAVTEIASFRAALSGAQQG
jgi:hypothetical protein